MNPFRFDKNFFSDDYLAQQVTWAFGLLLLSLLAVMVGVVLLRRAFGRPRRSAAGVPPPSHVATFERYEIGARLWHVGLVGILAALWISGAVFYAPGIVPGPVPIIGTTWLFVHLAFSAIFAAGLLVHVIKAPLVGGRSMWFDRSDWHQLVAGTRYYLGLQHELPKLGKYAATSKMFHVALVVLALTMIVTGIFLSLDTLGWAHLDQDWQRRHRLLHDFGTYGFLTVVVGHVFWQLLKNWSQSRAMVVGTITAETFRANHDWDKWRPEAVPPVADKGAIDHGP